MSSSTSWTFQRPYRTMGLRLYNLLGRQLRRLGWRRRLSLPAILDSAARWTKLSDWGDEWFHEPFQVLLDSLENDARLNSFGRLLTRLNLTHYAANRLRVRHALAAHPKILEQPVHRPIFVVGLPRTGTTLLHNLLCQHTGCRPLMLWEALQPAPNANVAAGAKDRRQVNARRLVNVLHRWGAPQLPAVHPIDPDGPEECTYMLVNTFVTPAFYLNGNVRGYIDWLQNRGRELLPRACEEYRQYLQVLQWGGPGGHWVLKSPAHSFGLEALLDLFPDACVIQTHRDMNKVIPSACSLFALSQGLYSDDVDCRRLGPELARLLRTHLLEPATQARTKHPDRVHDVHYRSLVADPIGCVRDIYRHFGLEVNDAMERRMRQWLAENPSNKHGAHHYDLEQFGLSRAEVDKLFGPYQEQFGLSPERRSDRNGTAPGGSLNGHESPASLAPPVPKYFVPNLPRRIRLLNRLGGRLRSWGVPIAELSEDAVLRAARRATGLDDWGDERFRPPLRILLDSYDRDRNLTFLGRAIIQRMIINLVANRLRIRRDLRAHPEILNGEIRRPLFVVGLPRTGTTLLYNLLAQDPGARPLLYWESMNPSPPPDPATLERDPRLKEADRVVGRLNRILPNLAAVHEITPRGPDECLGLLMNTFVTPFFSGSVPGYREWLTRVGEDELKTVYREYREQLQLLQWRVRKDHWILKCPSHLFGLDALLAAFPDACVVQTHRDPAEAIPSMCSLTTILDSLYYARIDLREVGERTVGKTDQIVRRGMKARATADPVRVYDLSYRDLVRDPLAAVRRIYEHFGYEYSAAMADKVRAYLAESPRHKHGVHRYSLDDFCLDRATVRKRFAEYYDRFLNGYRLSAIGYRPEPQPTADGR